MTVLESRMMGRRESSHQEFLRRLRAIPMHGLGLSVDIHAPNFASLRRNLLARQVPPDYFEVFHSTAMALESVRKEVGEGLLTYHGEGLWITQPGVTESRSFQKSVREASEHLQILQSAWFNHECAAKFLAGYYYGTYLPPLYTRQSADVVADNTTRLQRLLDGLCRLANGTTPLVLLEMPPLTYFVAGTLPIATFFQVVCDQSPCGLVLDVGHLWTVFRYTGAARTQSLPQFVETFLDTFPMHRIVEIHVAGLDIHESHRALPIRLAGETQDTSLPAWIDAHAAPIPSVLFEMLDQILSHPQLTSLRGLALEVDMKPEELIVDEFAAFSRRYAPVFQHRRHGVPTEHAFATSPGQEQTSSASARELIEEDYDRYVRVLVGKAEPTGPEWGYGIGCTEDLDLYRFMYLPYEILHWGGAVEDMFVETCRQLAERGVSLERFVTFWFRDPQVPAETYDFFLLKAERFVTFIREVAPDLAALAEQEAEGLRRAYRFANEPSHAGQVS